MNIENDAACQLTACCGCSRRTDGRAGSEAAPPLARGRMRQKDKRGEGERAPQAHPLQKYMDEFCFGK